MEYRKLGQRGPDLSVLGFGCGSVGGLFVKGERAEQTAAVETAIEGGINYFDTAALYGEGLSEQNLGEVLADLRAEVFVGTKIALIPGELQESRRALRRKLEEGLRRLGRDHVDVCTLHNFAGESSSDPHARLLSASAIRQVGESMRELQEAGLTANIGFTGLGETAHLEQVIDAGFDTIQCYVNVLNPSGLVAGSQSGDDQDFGGLVGKAADAGLGVIVIRVLAGGALSGETARHPLASGTGGALIGGADYSRDIERSAMLREATARLACESPLELSFRFVIAEPAVTVAVVGFSDRSQVEAAVRWASHGPLPREAVRELIA